MKRKQKRVTLLLASLLVGGFLVTGCTNSDYDFNEIDATMGFGGDGLELPASSTMDIPLKDVLDLEENGSVKLDDEGNYLFQLTGSGSSEANPKIEPIRLEGRSYNANIPISLSASAKATRSLTASSVIPEVKEKMFEYHGVDKSVKSLTKANMKPVTMKLTLGFSGISSVISKIKKATLTLPGYLSLNRVVGDGNGMPIPTSSRIDIADIPTSRDMVLTITSNELLFSEQDAYGTLSIAEDGIITAKPKAHAFKNEMCFPLTKTKCELKKHPNSKFECFFNDFNRTKTSLFLPFPSKLIQDNLVCVLELQE